MRQFLQLTETVFSSNSDIFVNKMQQTGSVLLIIMQQPETGFANTWDSFLKKMQLTGTVLLRKCN